MIKLFENEASNDFMHFEKRASKASTEAVLQNICSREGMLQLEMGICSKEIWKFSDLENVDLFYRNLRLICSKVISSFSNFVKLINVICSYKKPLLQSVPTLVVSGWKSGICSVLKIFLAGK